MPKEMRKCGQPIAETCWYEIGGEIFYQQTCIGGQTKRVIPYIHGVSFSDFNDEDFIKSLGDRIFSFLEIILVPKGVSQQDHAKDLSVPGKIERAEFFEIWTNHFDWMEFVSDFFGCNLNSSLGTLLREGPAKFLKEQNSGETHSTTMNGSAPLSQEETQPSAMGS